MSSTDPSVRECYEAALLMAPDAQSAFLASLRDPVKRSLLERMLGATEDDSEWTPGPAVDVVAGTLTAPEYFVNPSRWLGTTIGGARLLDLVGQGGSAVVFRGERVQEGVPQQVAVKVFRQVLLTDHEIRGFRRERLAMAHLDHPGIARLIDGGTTESGLAYIILEYVDGTRITDFAADNRLNLQQRLRLMIDVCHAVEAAHRALIVHRDLKPSNVLVTCDRHVKLLDFGIAKFLNADDDATEVGRGALTPAYAAPEQFRGEPITTATDVYALGVLLCEILTGKRPSSDTARPPSSLVDLAADAEDLPAPPILLRRQMRGDIDNIIQMAIVQDAHRRYASAGTLADDIERFLDSLPVRAHPPSRAYHAHKFYLRHRTALITASVLLSLLLAAVGTAFWQMRTAREYAKRVKIEAEFSRGTRDFMVDVFRMSEPAGERTAPPSVIEVTEAALLRIAEDARMDSRVRLDLKTQLGAVLCGQSKMDRGVAVLREAYAEGGREFGRAEALVIDAGLELADALVNMGDFTGAEKLLKELEEGAKLQDVDRQVAYQLSASTVAAMRGLGADALVHIDSAAELCTLGCSERSSFNLFTSQGNVNGILQRDAAAAEGWTRAVNLAKAMHGPTHVTVAQALSGLGAAFRRLGRMEDAKRIAIQVLEIDDRIGVPKLHWQRSLHLNHLAAARYSLGEYQQALVEFEQALAISRAVNGDDDEQLASDFQGIGAVYFKLGKFDKAIEFVGEALRRRSARDDRGRWSAWARTVLAHVLAVSGDTASALPLIDRSVTELRAAGEGSRKWLIDALRYRGKIQLLAGQPLQSMASLNDATGLITKRDESWGNVSLFQIGVIRGAALLGLRRIDEAKHDLSKALAGLGELKSDSHSQAQASFALGMIELSQKQCAEAKRDLSLGIDALSREPYTYAYLSTARDELAEALRASCPQ
jgi:eukaryotic-like serine/threonine-protein kinase